MNSNHQHTHHVTFLRAATSEASRLVMAVVQHDGTVTWYPHKLFQSSCAIDVRNFPFDNQTCHMWFGSWTHTLAELDLDLAFPEGIDLSTFKSVYKEASEWDIINATAERFVLPPEDAPGPHFPVLSFTVELERKMMFSTYILTMPAIFLSFLTLLVFWLPPEHADKNALGLTIFGSLLLLLLILVEAAPPTASAVPLLGVYYCFTTVIVILSIFLSSLVVKVAKSGKKHRPVPRALKITILDILAPILCLKLVTCRARQTIREPPVFSAEHGREKDHLEPLREKPENNLISRDIFDDVNLTDSQGTGIFLLESRLRSMHCMISDVIRKQNEKEANDRLNEQMDDQWRNLALVLDRLFFIVYLVGILISLSLLFPTRASEV